MDLESISCQLMPAPAWRQAKARSAPPPKTVELAYIGGVAVRLLRQRRLTTGAGRLRGNAGTVDSSARTGRRQGALVRAVQMG